MDYDKRLYFLVLQFSKLHKFGLETNLYKKS